MPNVYKLGYRELCATWAEVAAGSVYKNIGASGIALVTGFHQFAGLNSFSSVACGRIRRLDLMLQPWDPREHGMGYQSAYTCGSVIFVYDVGHKKVSMSDSLPMHSLSQAAHPLVMILISHMSQYLALRLCKG